MATTHGTFTFPSATTGDADRFIYDSPTQTAATLPAAAGTTRSICHDTNGGNSASVGPDQGADGVGDGYLYTECSSPGANGDNHYIQFDTALDASAEQWQFNFYTCQRGPAIGNNQSLCRVQINENGGGWIDASGELGGAGNDTTDGTAWTSQSIDLSAGGTRTSVNTLVRIWIQTQAATVWHGDYGVDSIQIVGTDLSTTAYTQASFRGRNDDGSETTATWKAATNTNWNQKQGETFRARFLIQETLDTAEDDVSFQLQYNRNSGGWNNVTGASSIVRSTASSNITDGGNTTSQIGAGTFVTPNAGIDEADGIAGGVNLDFTTTVNQEVELEYALQILSAGTSRGDTIQLRVIKGGSPLDTYTNTPTLTIPIGAGMTMASADFLAGSAGAQNPGVFDFQRGIPWGAITLALKPKPGGSTSALFPTTQFNTITADATTVVQDGATIDGLTFEGDVDLVDVVDLDSVTVDGTLDFGTAGTYDLSNCVVDTVTNSSGGAVIINATNTIVITNTGPNITINNSVQISISVKNLAGSAVSGARVYIEAAAGGPLSAGTEIVNEVTGGTGIITSAFNYTSDQPIVGRVRKSTASPYYKTAGISGSITSNGFSTNISLIGDE